MTQLHTLSRIFINLRLGAAIVLASLATNAVAQHHDRLEVMLASEVDWQKLNPARGDQSPQAGTLWGDRNGSVQTGFLVKFVDGFSSPPHIHNITYRGVVLSGLVHNDDPDAKPMWMPTGSYWTQPAGEAHITSARGSTIAFIEIEHGPYLVKPTDEAFDSGQRPVNVERSNLVWLDESSTSWIAAATQSRPSGPEISFLWGKPGNKHAFGTLVKLPREFSGEIRSNGSDFKAVVVEGQIDLKQNDSDSVEAMAGSYVHAEGKSVLSISCKSESGCMLYVRTNETFSIH